ncbi:MAG: hypothetical protein ACE5H4_02035 [Candidatus Thorarchaeota archaeon]
MVVSMVPLILQTPFDIPAFPPWMEAADLILNVFFALVIRGYLILVLVGFMIYVTGLSDGLAKTLVVFGVAMYIAGPYLLGILADLAGVTPPTLEDATGAWFGLFGMTDAELIDVLVTLGDIIVAVAILAGAIMYFTPLAGDLKTKGQSLVVRGLLLIPILSFFHIAAWL